MNYSTDNPIVTTTATAVSPDGTSIILADSFAHCQDCGREVRGHAEEAVAADDRVDGLLWSMVVGRTLVTLCPECAAARQALDEAKRVAERVARIEAQIVRSVPPLYRSTDPEHPGIALLWDHVRGWRPTPERPFLGLIGATGTGKTRSAVLAMRDGMLDDRSERPECAFTTAYQAAATVHGQWSPDREEAQAARGRIHELQRVRWLVLDDLGKSKLTPAVAEATFSILDARAAHLLPTVWTSNSRPDSWCSAARMDDSFAEPLRGRLLEFSTVFEL